MTDKYQYCLVLRKAPQVTLTINPTPSDATVKLNGVTQSSVTVLAGDTVNFEVSKNGYCTKKGTATIQRTSTAAITLSTECSVTAATQQDGVTITISDTVNTVTDTTAMVAKLTTVAGRNVTITMSKAGYTTKTETISGITSNISTVWCLQAAPSS